MLPGIALVAPPAGPSVPPVGNLRLFNTWAAFESAVNDDPYDAEDVLSINHVGYTPTTPQVLNITRSFDDGQVCLVLNRAQNVQVAMVGLGAVNVQIVNGTGGADTVQGNFNETSVNNATVYAKDCSDFAVYGFESQDGLYGTLIDNCTDYIIDVLSYGHRKDANFVEGVSQRAIYNNPKVRDAAYLPNFYCVAGVAGSVSWDVDPGGTRIFIDGFHPDALQIHGTGTTDILIVEPDFSHYGQGLWVSDNEYQRIQVVGGVIAVAFPWHLSMNGGNFRVSGLEIGVYPGAYVPSFTAPYVGFFNAAGNGPWEGGQCVFTAPGVVTRSGIYPTITNDYGINLTSPTLNPVTVTLPTPPGFVPFDPTVVDIAALRQQPSYTDYSGPIIAHGQPRMVTNGPGFATSISAGEVVQAYPPPMFGFYTDAGDDVYWWWLLDGVEVQAPTQGFPGASYTASDGDGALKVGFSEVGGTDPADYAFSEEIAVGTPAVVPGDQTWTLTGSSNIALSDGDLKATKTSATTFRCVRGTESILLGDPSTPRWSYVEFIPSQGGSSGAAIGFGNASVNMNNYLGADANAYGMFSTGGIFGAQTANATPGMAFNGTNVVGLLVDNANDVYYIHLPTGWASLCGDPLAGGAGFSCSALAGQNVFPYGEGNDNGDFIWINVGQTTFAYAADLPPATYGWGA